ncbi:CHAT domain-containing protein [Streptomyces durmitorensis]|uniref:CHAT domain-containing protein n=1 Tax=Streptomyces durmitorensis TaxID=319947 RepID=A0ABY4Q3S8_9ACTN|nr:CHAT domain-containing protein [Streptomyces durmitorensis]UQT60722.1 CHAT domain-containing protein [Streptomyces durmitorensis]
MDSAEAHLYAQRWDAAIVVLESTLREIAMNRGHFRTVRLAIQHRQAAEALAVAYACTGRYDDAWRTMEELPGHDMFGDPPHRVDHRGAGFEGLGILMSLIGGALGEGGAAAGSVRAPESDWALDDGRAGVGLLQILGHGSTTVLLLRTLGEGGTVTTRGVRREVENDVIAEAFAAFGGTTSADAENYLLSLDSGIAETTGARVRMAAAFARVAPLLVEPLRELLGGSRLRSVGICDDGRFNHFPFEALPWPDPTTPAQVLGDRYGVCFVPSAASGLPCRAWQRRERPRVLFVAYDGADLDTDRDIARMRELTGLDVTVMHTADCAKREILTELSKDYSLVHFSCHGRFDILQPSRSALLLSKKAMDVLHFDDQGLQEAKPGDQRYQLTGEDLDEIHMPGAPVVSLFACSSAAPKPPMNFGFTGLPGAFLRAGASAVIGSRWSASNDLCFSLLSTMYAAINDGMPPGAAFFAARRTLPSTQEPTVFHQGLFCYIGAPDQETS